MAEAEAAAEEGITRGVDGSFLGNSGDRLAVRLAEGCEARAGGAIERTTSRPAIHHHGCHCHLGGAGEAVMEGEHFLEGGEAGGRGET
jgi:hypothetical protein